MANLWWIAVKAGKLTVTFQARKTWRYSEFIFEGLSSYKLVVIKFRSVSYRFVSTEIGAIGLPELKKPIPVYLLLGTSDL